MVCFGKKRESVFLSNGVSVLERQAESSRHRRELIEQIKLELVLLLVAAAAARGGGGRVYRVRTVHTHFLFTVVLFISHHHHLE